MNEVKPQKFNTAFDSFEWVLSSQLCVPAVRMVRISASRFDDNEGVFHEIEHVIALQTTVVERWTKTRFCESRRNNPPPRDPLEAQNDGYHSRGPIEDVREVVLDSDGMIDWNNCNGRDDMMLVACHWPVSEDAKNLIPFFNTLDRRLAAKQY